jgi:hypothetical protein
VTEGELLVEQRANECEKTNEEVVVKLDEGGRLTKTGPNAKSVELAPERGRNDCQEMKWEKWKK